MRSVYLKNPGATFTKSYRYGMLLPITTLPDTLLLFGNDSVAQKNLAVEYANDTTTVVGTPTLNAGYATLSEVNYVNNGLSAAGQHTLMIVCKRPGGTPGTNQGLIGNWTPGGATANLLFSDGNNQKHSINGGTKALQAFNQGSSFAFMAATWDGATSTVYAHNGTSMLSATSAYAGSGGSSTPLRVGGLSDLSTTAFDVACAARFPSALNSSDVAAMHTYLKTFLATRVITVL